MTAVEDRAGVPSPHATCVARGPRLVGGERLYNVGPIDRIPLGEGRTVGVGDEEVAIFRTRHGEVYAVRATCPHRGGPLADGIIGDGRVVCPLHSYAFELATGQPVRDDCPALRTYRVSVDEQGMVLVHVDAVREEVADVAEEVTADADGARR